MTTPAPDSSSSPAAAAGEQQRPGILIPARKPVKPKPLEDAGEATGAHRVTTSTHEQRSFFLFSWFRDVGTSLAAPTGWKLLVRAVVFIGGGVALLLALLTYQDQVRATLADAAERSYGRLVDDLNAASEALRISALRRIPAVMTRRVPESGQIAPWKGLQSLIGRNGGMKAVYHQEAQRLCHLFMKRAKAVSSAELDALRGAADAGTPNLPATAISREESEAITGLLASLGYKGWYHAEAQAGGTGRGRLAWVWLAPPRPDAEYPALTLFEGVRIDGLELSMLDLSGTSFAHSQLRAASFVFSSLDRSSFARAILPGADFRNTTLTASSFERSYLPRASFADATLLGCDFRLADLRHSSLRGASIAGARFFGAILDYSNLSGTRADAGNAPYASGAFFQDASMRGAYMAHANLAGSQLQRVTLDGATLTNAILQDCDLRFSSAREADFSFATVSGARLDLADLTKANLTSIRGLEEIVSCTDTNIADVVGLSEAIKDVLIAKGAVSIPALGQWNDYKAAGRPHERWREYAERR